MASAQTSPAPTFSHGTRLFVSVLAVSYACAFASIWIQAGGLMGPSGILPAHQLFFAACEQLGREAWYDYPSLCWFLGDGAGLDCLCAAGLLLSVLLFLRIAPAVCLLLMWACYLSLATAGQDFFNFQWDALILESTLVAVCVVPWTLRRTTVPYNPPKLGRYLIWWLLFRLMFLSGAVKLRSGDPTWRHLTALTFHYQTQPLPTPVAWYAHQLPHVAQVACCAVLLLIELAAPFGLLAPRRIRHGAVLSLIGLQLLIALTGNYAFFNLLTIGLCLAALDDDWWRGIHWGVEPVPAEVETPRRRLRLAAVRWFAAVSVGITFFEVAADLSPGAARSPLVRFLIPLVDPVRSFNVYGLFQVMTVERPELIFEGSDDGREWKEYTLPFKPGDPSVRPKWVAPYQPRLDWQLWFAALGSADANPWVSTVCEKLLRGNAAVLRLFARNPFPDHPPRYVRVVRYRYEFTDSAERARTGNWWRRTPLDFYISPVTLPAAP